jgi:hypothetical protein
MTRTAARTTTLVVGLALMGGALLANCNKGDSTGDVGTLRLALKVPPNGPTVNSVSWQILAPGGAILRQGVINTSDQNATASVDTSCPATNGSRVTMAATATDGTSCTGTSAPFNVAAGGIVMVGVQLVCGGGTFNQTNGSVIVNGTFINGNNCPGLTSWVASPLQTSVGGQINLAAVATDADTADRLTYNWTASGAGSFAPANDPSTVFVCGGPGIQTLTVVVSDNHAPTPCTATMTFPITCIGGECGDGIIQPGEQCEPPNTSTCDAMCQLKPLCGNGVIDPGEACDPPNGTTCSPTCQPLPFCGDGIVEPPEQCEPPNTATCDSICRIIIVETKCSPPTACTVCEQDPANVNVCPPELLNVANQPAPACFGCDGFLPSTTAVGNCNALLTCVRTTHCARGDDPTPCYCGNLDPGTCVTSGAPPTAPCFAQYNAAAVGFPGNVFTQFFDPTTPIGIVDNTVSCDADAPCTCP